MKFFKDLGKKLLKNRSAMIGICVIIFFLIISVLAPLICTYTPEQIAGATRIPPFFSPGGGSEFILGTDDLGRDIFARLLYGGRISLSVGFFVVVLSMSFGVVLGLLSGYYAGFIDKFIMRVMEILMALPSILLAIVVVAILGPGLNNAIIAVALVALPPFVRVVRASVMAEKEKDYVNAAKSLGASDLRIMFLQILPNCNAPIIVQASLGFSEGILSTAALGFLGLGAQAPTPEWGIMLSDARAYIESDPWMVTLPGLCILFVVLAFNLLGDGLRDILDPKLRK